MTLKYTVVSLILISMLITSESQYNLYYSDRSSETDLYYDCLHYKVLDNIVTHNMLGSSPRNSHQIISYCMRPLNTVATQHPTVDRSSSSSNFTFETLKNLKVTAQDLLLWSAPVDLVERYQNYLDSSKLILRAELFYNCTSPWFGAFCEYTFDSNEPIEDIVRKTFIAKKNGTNASLISDITNLTCYAHLDCNRGNPFLCLDWREICNGHVDCLDDGIDEKYCLQLELNECEANEYRCHNGICVDKQFFNDDPENPDCLDRTDENNDENSNFYRTLGFSKCFMDPAFRCEDSDQFFGYPGFVCGDGQQIRLVFPGQFKVFPEGEQSKCANNRDHFLFLSVPHQIQGSSDLSFECRLLMICVVAGKRGIDCIKTLCGSVLLPCFIPIEKICNQSKYVILPVMPTIQNYAQFGYWTNKTITYDSFERIPLPDFVCYNVQRCPDLSADFKISNLTCFNLANTGLVDLNFMIAVFHTCLSLDEIGNETDCFHPQMFHCSNSRKCISKHRLLDGVIDCPTGDDETYNQSCELNHSHRFQCSSEKNKCLSPVMIHDFQDQCRNGEDEHYSHERKLPFQHLCDAYTHLPVDSEKGLNETDETNCEQWPCSNQYTRCDRVWTCANGADEVNCQPTSSCYPDHHECVSPITFKVMCLSINRTGDGKIDCLGATDEREYCRQQYPEQPFMRYRCWNEAFCTFIGCLGVDFCAFERTHSLAEECKKNPHLVEIFASLGNEFIVQSVFYRASRYFKLGNTTRFRLNRSSTRSVMVHKSMLISPARVSRLGTDFPFKMMSKEIAFRQAWICNRGILIFLGVQKAKHCLCPPSYYGHRCEFQNERISLTLQFRKECTPSCLASYGIVLMLIDSDLQIHAYEQLTYISANNCDLKYNLYFLYRSRPKNLTMNYTIRIDAYNKINLVYHASWLLPIKFLFLPVNRIATHLIIPSQPFGFRRGCQFTCGDHGHCTKYINTEDYFCHCKSGWSGQDCTIRQVDCACSPESICVGQVFNRSICLCSQNQTGPRCLLHSVCRTNPCKNGGQCIPEDDRISMSTFTCICTIGYSGSTCDVRDTRIEISFNDVEIPLSLLIHFVTVQDNNDPLVTTISKKLAFDQNSLILYTSVLFNMIFVQVNSEIHLAYLQIDASRLTYIELQMKSFQHCATVRHLFNEETLAFPLLRRAKYYHVLCREYSDLNCFYDKEMFMCLCNKENYANCFPFNSNKSSICRGRTTCENGGQCLLDHAICPTTTMCICAECFYGGRCQFTTKDLSLSLDIILGYQIRPYVSVARQSIAVKISIVLTTLILIIGLINSILSIMTFRLENLNDVGCGLYLLMLSIISLLSVVVLTLKFWLLVCFQALWITNRSVLLVNCISTEYILRSLIALEDWFTACVAVERVLVVIKGINFDQRKSKQIARWVVVGIMLSTLLSFVYEPIHRELIDDEEEQRTWCIVRYSPRMKIFDSAMHILHFIMPFFINLFAAIFIIVIIARTHSTVRKQKTYKKHLYKQFYQQKHLIISPIILVTLALPRLVISFLSGCMKSMRDPWLFLMGYFISFLPSTLTFAVFIWPSTVYKREFNVMIRRYQTVIQRRLLSR